MLWTELLGAQVTFVGTKHAARVLVLGTGTPLLLLHGQGGHLENFRHNIPAYAAGHQVIAMDMLWHGLSDKPGPVPDDLIKALADHVIAVLDELGVDHVSVEGQSMGGWVAAYLALRHPERIDRLVLTTPMGLTPAGHSPDPDRAARVLTAQLEALADPTPDAIRRRMSALFADDTWLDDEMVELRSRLYSDRSTRQALEAVARRYFAPDFISTSTLGPDSLARIAAPTLVYWGSANSTPAPVGRQIADAIPNAEWHCATAGHWAQYERPKEHNRVVMQFLARHGG